MMAADDLLQALAAQERESLQARPPEWDELAHGKLAPDAAVDRVRERGSMEEMDESDLVRGRELFTPPSAAFDDALVDRLVAMTRASAAPSAPAPAVAASAPANGAEVIHVEPSWWQRRRAIVAAGIMAAAAAVLVVAWPRTATDQTDSPRVMLPRHDMWIEADAAIRGSATEVRSLAPGAAMRVYLRPDRGYEVMPSIAACLRKGDDTRVLVLEASSAKPGETVDLGTRLPDDLGEGRWELVTLISGGDLPRDVATSCVNPPADLQVARMSIDVAR